MPNSKILLSHIIQDYKFIVYNDQPELIVKKVNQVHGSEVLSCDQISPDTKADGIVCVCGKCILAIKTADCLPIAIVGKNGIALIHAGWRGLALEIIFSEKIALINPISFYIGPHIRQDAYEVGEDFFTNFPNHKPIIIADKIHCSLSAIAISQIKIKYPSAKIDESNICTFEDISYNSYRRNKTNLRNWNILLKG